MNLSIKELNELIYSLGIAAHNGRFVNKDVNESLLERMYSELNVKIAEEAIDEEVNIDEYVEGTTEDGKMELPIGFGTKEFNDMCASYFGGQPIKKERGYITQALLDYVDKKGAVSYGELETYYKIITGGSNSFSHILDSLRTPYRNRKTQRYIAKEGRRYTDAKYVIKVANPSNWVIVND